MKSDSIEIQINSPANTMEHAIYLTKHIVCSHHLQYIMSEV